MANKTRLIDANELPNGKFVEPRTEWHQGWNDALDAAMSQAPTVDAVELPCKIGDKVYRIDKGNFYSNRKPFIQELTVTEISWKKEKYGDKDLGFAIIADGIRYKFSSIGKSVFLTREEAEAKMDGGKNND